MKPPIITRPFTCGLCVSVMLAMPALADEGPPLPVDFKLNFLTTPATYSGCSDYASIDELECSELVSAPIAGPTFVWVVLSDLIGFVDGVGAAQFGIEHDLVPIGWTLCTGGAEIPSEGWPASGTGNAMTWSGGCYHSPGGSARIGYLSVDTGDVGAISIVPDPRIPSGSDGVIATNCLAETILICEAYWGALDLAAGTPPSCEPDWMPLPPTAVDASDDLCGEVRVTWEYEGLMPIGFNIRRDGTVIAFVDGDVREFVDTDPTSPNVPVPYRLATVNACAELPDSDSASGRSVSIPDAPTDCQVQNISCDGLEVSWTLPGQTVELYLVYRNDTLIASVPAQPYLDTDVEAGVEYEYYVRASNICGEGAELNRATGEITPEPPEAATNCAATDGLCEFVVVTWNDESTTETAFAIVRDGTEIDTVSADITLYRDHAVVLDQVYVYAVVARNTCGDASASNPDTGFTTQVGPLDPPSYLYVDQQPFDPTVRYRWAASEGALGYVLRASLDGCFVNPIEEWTVAGTDTTIEYESDPPYPEHAWITALGCGGVESDPECGVPEPGTPVLIESFIGASQDGVVTLEWRTIRETSAAGFHVWRAFGDGDSFARLTEEVIPATSGPYRYADPGSDELVPGQAYRYRLTEQTVDGEEATLGHVHVEVPAHPATLALRAAPNPFNPRTEVAFDLPKSARVDLTIFDAAGRLVRSLVSGSIEPAGRHACTWDGRDDAGADVASGVYFAWLRAGGDELRVRLVLLR